MGHRLQAVRLLVAALAALALVPATASAHSLVRQAGGTVSYHSLDVTSLNTLSVDLVGGDVRFRDPTVDGGMDTGSCRPGEVDSNGYIIEAFCPAAATLKIDIDVDEREDKVTVNVPIPVTLAGGAGSDELTAGGGNDTVTGGDGQDQINARDGDDTVKVRDGSPDQVTCGAGNDTVDADQLDNVADDCENVTRTEVTPVSSGDPNAGPDKTPPDVYAGGFKTRQRLGKGVIRLLATATEPGAIAASGFISIDGLRLPVRAPSVRLTEPGRPVALRLKLSKSQRRKASRALRRRKRVYLRLGVVATDKSGNSGERKAPRITLRR
jgi:hypothetical protein